MTILLVDGCEDYTSWTTAGSPTLVAGRNANAWNMTTSGMTATYNLAAADQTDTLTLGAAVKLQVLPASTQTMVTFKSDAGVTSHGTLNVTTTGQLVWQRTSTVLATTPANTVVANTWVYIEVSVKLSDTVGAVTIKANGAVVASATNVDTKNAGTKTVFDQLVIAGVTGSTNTGYDDLYLTNDATTYGDCIVQTLYPNGDGSANQWLGSDGNSTSNYLLVNEVGTPVTTSFTGSPTVGQQDVYALGDLASLPAGGAIVAVCHAAHVQKTDAGAASFKFVNHRAADNKSAAVAPTTTFTTYHYVLAADPETGTTWTTANVNALQAGLEVA